MVRVSRHCVRGQPLTVALRQFRGAGGRVILTSDSEEIRRLASYVDEMRIMVTVKPRDADELDTRQLLDKPSPPAVRQSARWDS